MIQSGTEISECETSIHTCYWLGAQIAVFENSVRNGRVTERALVSFNDFGNIEVCMRVCFVH